jgi:SsrA-binding protein
VSLADAYARIERDEAWIVGLHIAPWESTDLRFNHEPKRARKLLLHRHQIDELLGKTKAKGLTLVPLSIYINDRGIAKLQLGLARGKQTWDRRREIADRDAKRDMARQVADARRH